MEPPKLTNLIGKAVSGRYQIQQELGKGGMGSVYLAEDTQLDRRKVVIKFPHWDLLSDATFRMRFLKEIRSLANLDHPNIVKIHDAGEYAGAPYAVVQFVDGGDLGERLRERLAEPVELLPWLRVIAETLDFVHRHGFCHRDVKPANIFLDREGHAYLSDFGIATAVAHVEPDTTPDESSKAASDLGACREVATDVSPDPDATLPYDTQLTAFGSVIGSAAYCPPEARRRQLGPAYDEYSLAVTVYYALSGKLPVEAPPDGDWLRAKNEEAPAEIGPLVPALPQRSAAALMRALATNPEDRFASSVDFFEEFSAALQAERRGRLAWVYLGLALALVASISVWLVVRPPPARTTGPPVLTERRSVLLGSIGAELRAAIALCRSHGGGCDPSWFAHEEPREVELDPYALDLYEVSAGEFAAFVEAEGYETTAERRGYSYDHNVSVEGRSWREPQEAGTPFDPKLPVVHVSWHDAAAFCRTHGMRLPTEDEWEYAARGDERRIFPWGDGWIDGNASWDPRDRYGLEPAQGNEKGATPLGHQQMSGNAAEWVASSAGDERLIKGGSWQDIHPALLRAAARTSESPDYSSSDLGFRCARDLE